MKKRNVLSGMLGSLLGAIPGAIYLMVVIIDQKEDYIPPIIILIGSFLASGFFSLLADGKSEKDNKKEEKKGEFDPGKYIRKGNNTSLIGVPILGVSFLQTVLTVIISIGVTYSAFIISIAILLNRIYGTNIFIAFFQAVPHFFAEAFLMRYFMACSLMIAVLGLIMLIRMKIWGF